MFFPTIFGLTVHAEEAYTDATAYTWRLVHASWASANLADRPPFWTYLEPWTAPPGVNEIALRVYPTREDAVAAIEADARDAAARRSEREGYREWTITQAEREFNRPPKPAPQYCQICMRDKTQGATFTLHPHGSLCDDCHPYVFPKPDDDAEGAE